MSAIETVNQWAGVWVEFIFIRILDSTLVFLLVGLLWLIVRRKASAQFGYLMFLLVLLKLIMPVQFSVPGLITYWFPESAVQEKITGIGFDFFGLGGRSAGSETTETVKNQDTKSIAPIATSRLTAPSLFLSIWLMGVLAFLLYQTWVEWKTRFMMRNTIALDPQSFPVNLQKLQEIAGIKRQVKWVTGYWVKSPVAYGYFRPIIAVPSDIAQHYTVQQLRWILLHELAHIKRGDAFVFLFQRFLLSLFFFHPVVWCANALIDQLREYACDDAALVGSQASPRECGEGFLGAVMQSNGLPTFLLATHGLINYKTMIRRRLMRIINNTHPFQAKLSILAKAFLLLFTLFAVPFSLNDAMAQIGQWERIATEGPSPRLAHTMVYDSARNRIVLYGGGETEGAVGQDFLKGGMWEWDGNRWIEINLVGLTPGYKGRHVMAYDENRQRVVMFGGWAGNISTMDTSVWEYDGMQWFEILAIGPTKRIFSQMVYDSKRNRMILHGGGDPSGSGAKGDTWAWDGSEWTLLSESGPKTMCHMMAYDSIRDKIVLFGGYTPDGNALLTETWEFDGQQWTRFNPANSPEPRVLAGMVFNPKIGKVNLYGGAIKPNNWELYGFVNDSWEWDGTQWLKIDDLAPTKFGYSIAYDTNQDAMVIFGGCSGISGSSYPPVYTVDQETWRFRFGSSGMPFNIWSKY